MLAENPVQTLPERLREATAASHAGLEQHLGLLEPPVTKERFIRLLGRFWGFHAVWEPAVASLIRDEAFLAPRRRLAHLARDLEALGAGTDDLPLAPEAGDLADTAEAWGSVYVMEGSTLGGRFISRALAGQDWLPPGGLSYFDPHGAETGAFWRGVRERLAGLPDGAADRVVQGALDTFERLRRWLPPHSEREGA